MPEPIVAPVPVMAPILEPSGTAPPQIDLSPAIPASPPDALAKGQFGTHFGLDAKQKTLPKSQALAIAKAAGFASVGALQRFVGIKRPDQSFGEQTFLAARAFLLSEADKPQSALTRDRMAKLAIRLFPADHPVVAKLADNPAQKVLDAFSTFVAEQHDDVAQGLEMDCADFAGYLWHQFSATRNLDDGLPGTFETLTQNNKLRGIYGVNKHSPTVINDTLHARLFEQQYAEPIVLDRSGTAVTGKTFKAGGRTLDYGQLKPGDMLFYDYLGSGASHTAVVVGNDPHNRELQIAYGNYASVWDDQFRKIGVNPLPIKVRSVDYGSSFVTSGLMGVYQVKVP